MDNNYYNNMNQNQNQSTQNNQNGYNPYNSNSQGQTYQNTSYNAYNPYQQPTGGPAPRKPRRRSGFGATIGKCAAVALVFGLVAGGVFTGVSYVGTKALGVSGQNVSSSKSSSSANVSQTSTGNATDLSDVSGIAKEAMPSIVAITNTGTVSYQTFWGTQQQQSESAGSGIIIKQDSKYLYIATNNHVVADADSLKVQFVDNETVECKVQGTDASDDLAVVKVALSDIKDSTLKEIKVATVNEDTDTLEVGQGVIAIGNALGYGQSVTNGIISALGRTVTVQDEQTGETVVNNNMIQTNAAINPGNSGGALLNASGEVVGINSAKYSDTSVEGFELCFLARVIAVGSSSIVMTSGQSMISKSETLTFSFSAAALIFFSSPVKTICTWSSSAARRQPFIISSGALSPPNASIMIRMFFPHFNIQLPAKAGFVRAFRFTKHGFSADKPL